MRSPQEVLFRLRQEVETSREARRLEELRASYRQADARRRKLLEVQAALREAEALVSTRRQRLEQVGRDVALVLHATSSGSADIGAALEGLRQQIAAAEQDRLPLGDQLRELEQRRSFARQREDASLAVRATLTGLLGAPVDLAVPELLQRAVDQQRRLNADITDLEATGARLSRATEELTGLAAVSQYLDLKADAERL